MKKFLFLLLKIFLVLLFVFLALASIPVPILIVPTLLLFGLILFLWRWHKKIKNLPILTESAKAISKYHNVVRSHHFVGTRHYITFEFTDGTRRTLVVPAKSYGCIIEGESGTVSYKKNNNLDIFIDFQRVRPY